MSHVATLLVSFLLSLPLAAQTKTGFVEKTFRNKDDSESPYVVFVPHDYDGKKEYPVILFLHGSGETKGGTKKPVEVGIGTAIRANEKKFEFITVIPQSEKRTWMADSDDGKRAIAILDSVMKEYRTDAKRQILTGLSMGGAGTWSVAAAHADRWAAIVPICGFVQPKSAGDIAKKIRNLPCWCFHGDADKAVNVSKSREMIEAIKQAGGSPRYTEYPGVSHNSWDKAYAEADLWIWLAKQKK